jgi:dihydrodipicolinate synthase/N-acetylneuraminate lyase
MASDALALFAKGGVIPAHPLALTAERKLDERRQVALSRYYIDAGATGLAVGVHTTQFAIHDNGMLRLVLELAAGAARDAKRAVAMIAGVQGPAKQAVAEAELAKSLGYDLVLLRPMAGPEDEMIARARAVGEVLPVVGFYLQPAVGGMVLPRSFWARFAAIESVVGIKVAPFDRYRTIDVLQGVAQSGRASAITLYTGNDNNILSDLVTPYRFGDVEVRFTGGLLGQFAVWTKRAVELLAETAKARAGDAHALRRLLLADGHLTDANAAIFDVAGAFHGCVPGIHEILRRQGLLAGRWCLDLHEDLSPGQMAEIDRVYAAYSHLADDAFVAENLDRWLR